MNRERFRQFAPTLIAAFFLMCLFVLTLLFAMTQVTSAGKAGSAMSMFVFGQTAQDYMVDAAGSRHAPASSTSPGLKIVPPTTSESATPTSTEPTTPGTPPAAQHDKPSSDSSGTVDKDDDNGDDEEGEGTRDQEYTPEEIQEKISTFMMQVETFVDTVSDALTNGEARTYPDPVETREIARRAYIFAYPMLEFYKTMYHQAIDESSPHYWAPMNEFKHFTELVDAAFSEVVSPNNDTLYSPAWLDLRAEPIILTVPPIADDRYFSFQLVDMYTHNFGYVGSRTTGQRGGKFLIAGPSYQAEIPKGIDGVFRSEGNFVLVIGRFAVAGKDDVANVTAIQDKLKLTPLSTMFQLSPPTPADITFPPYDQQKAQSAGFITYLNFLLGQVQSHPSDLARLAEFSKIGIGPDRPFDPAQLDPLTRTAIDHGVALALKEIETEIQNLGEVRGGWQLTRAIFGTREQMQGKRLIRAAAAMFGLFGNSIEEAFYPTALTDESGEPLDGAKHAYVIHFSKDQLPPVDAFWSVTLYGLPDRLLVDNSLDRYSIGDRTEGLNYDEDGSLTIYIQHESPGSDKQSNWLPAPAGPFYLIQRLYWPAPAIIDGTWTPTPIQRVESSAP